MADLSTDQRSQLDGIVQQMHANHETDDYIQSVVDDFKAKNAGTPTPSIAERNAQARANMAKQHEGEQPPSFTHEFIRGVEEGTTPPDAGMGRRLLGAAARVGPGRAMTGSEEVGAGQFKKGAHDLITGGGTTAAMMFAPEIAANPVTAATALAFGAGGDVIGRKTAEALGGNEDTQNLVGDVAGLAAGGVGAKAGKALPVEPVLRFTGGELARPGGVQGVVGRGIQAGADMADELSARARGPISEMFSSGTKDPAVIAANRAKALADAKAIEDKTLSDQHAEALRTNRRLISDAAAVAKKNAPPKGTKSAAPVDVAQMMRDRLSGTAGLDANVPVPERPTPAAAPQGTGLERTIDKPLWQQQQAMETGEALTGRKPVEPPPSPKSTTPVHPQQGVGGRGSETSNPQDVANSYAKANGFAEPKPHTPVKVDPEFGKKVADAYDAMKHDPNDPETKRAYDALAKEVEAQFEHITKTGGLKVEPLTKDGPFYPNSKAMTEDVRQNNHMWYYPSESGFGAGSTVADNPLLAKGKNGMPINDMLRVVHDYFAHAVEGHQFGANGEENAFLAHLKMLSPEAGRALATETRGQNSFVNFGKHMRNAEGDLLKPGDKGFLPVQDRPYAQQKTGLLPEELLPESLRRTVTTIGGPGGPQLANAAKMTPADFAELNAFLGKNEPLNMSGKLDSMQVVGDEGGPNASGESAASREALSRQKSMKAGGEKFAIRKGNTTRALIGPDAVDYNPQPGEEFGVIDKDGNFRVLSLGEAREKLIGARHAGHMTKANREALFNALLKRAGKK